MTRGGRCDKTVEAHRGAVTGLQWAPDGSALLTGGEDGSVKVWSKSAMLRSTLATTAQPVYSASWGPEERVLYATGHDLVVKPLQPNAKTEQWKAHDGVVLAVDWSLSSNRIVSGAEDFKYKVWDAYGRQLFSSAPHDFPVQSVAWAPAGDLFAVAGYRFVRLCDGAGWSRSLDRPVQGSVYSLAWSGDGTRIAGGCADGTVMMGQVVGRRLAWNNWEVTVVAADALDVVDAATGNREHLSDFRDPVVKLSFAHGHLVVGTSSQCLVYRCSAWHSPVTIDIKGPASFVLQSAKHLLFCDAQNALHAFSYDGRLVCSPKLKTGGRSSDVPWTQAAVSMSDDTVALRDPRDPKTVHLLDLTSGSPVGRPVAHTIEIEEVALDQGGPSHQRLLAFVDKNRDLLLCAARSASAKAAKLGTMVQTMLWHDQAASIAAMCNGKFTVWHYPGVVFVDPDVLALTRDQSDATDLGKAPVCVACPPAVPRPA